MVYLIIFGVVSLGIWSFFHLNVSENIDAILPGNKSYKKIEPLLNKGKKAVIFSMKINPENNSPYQIEKKADSLVANLNSTSGSLVSDFQFKSDMDPDSFGIFFYNHLYLFLDDTDYLEMEKEISNQSINEAMTQNRASLLSPEGIALKDWMIRDPLHFMRFGYNKLKKDVMADAFLANEGLFISEDGTKLFIYAKLRYNPSESKFNKELKEKLDFLKSDWNSKNPKMEMDYFGTFLVANANATQIEKDIKWTISIAMIFILALIFYYYRNPVILSFFLMPGVFGVLLAVAGIYLWQGHISGIALSAGAVVLGIVVDYSFHFFSKFKQNRNAKETRKQILLPLLVSGTTTIAAFFSLTFAQSEVLNDFGLFTAFSLIGALIFVLAFLPMLLEPFEKKVKFSASNKLDTWFDKINLEPSSRGKWFIPFIVLATVVLYYFATDIQFENDLNKINFYPEELKQTEIAHQNINPDIEKRVHFLVEGTTSNIVAENNEALYHQLANFRDSFQIKQINSLGLFVLSETVQQQKINQWNSFWEKNSVNVWHQIKHNADSLGFSATAFNEFNVWVSTKPHTENLYHFVEKSKSLSHLLLPDSVNNDYALITSVVLPKAHYEDFKTQFSGNEDAYLVDGSSIMSMLTETVKDDFNYLLLLAGALVLIAMLLIYGNIELTLVSFIPIAISWIWILGIATLLDFKFNFVNIIIVTFIFGLGDDFAIFITDGLQTQYKYGRKVLGEYKAGIVLSSASTVIGTGALIFAKHPAIKSIAGISVIGILTIVFISFFVQPIVFHFFITRRTNQHKPPVTILSILVSIIGYTIFILGSLLGVFLGLIIRIIPFTSTEWKKRKLHQMLKSLTGLMLDILFTTTKRYYGMKNLDFSKPSVIIANHASFFDILALARLHPNIIMLVNKWVYDSVLFGNAIRFADYVPTFESLDENLDRVDAMVKKGYSVVVFPEGKRSVDGKINRFHKGSFFLAEKLKLDITPVVLHGYAYTMPKHDYNLKSSYLSTTVLPRIKYDDTSFGSGYKERTKNISKFFKSAYQDSIHTCGEMDYQYYPLLFSYRYKGPVLEWYFRIKWRFEKQHYENYFQQIGRGKKRVYDLGCGYGFLSHFLKLRNEELTVFGFDYDEDKVAVAQNSYLITDGIQFEVADVSTVKPENADAIIIADTLHYLSEEAQLQTLKNCDSGLNPGGLLLIRDGLSDLGNSHEWTKNSEKWSTKIMKFNKVNNDLHFFSKLFIEKWAKDHGYSITFDMQSENSSNTLMSLRKKNN